MRKALFLLTMLLLLCLRCCLLGADADAQPGYVVAKELWCPLCNGVRLDNCELQACVQMREVIAQKLVAGESKEQIKAYFAQQYGDVVLGEPAREGFNLVVWIFPILAGGGGSGLVGVSRDDLAQTQTAFNSPHPSRRGAQRRRVSQARRAGNGAGRLKTCLRQLIDDKPAKQKSNREE